MKVAIDVQTTLGEKTGFGFYVENLVDQLEQIGGHEYIKISPSKDEDFKSIKRWWWDQVGFPLSAAKRGADVIHQPAFSAPIFANKPVVVTVHDLIALYFPQDIRLGSRLYFGKWMPLSCKLAADHIIAISKHTKRDIVKLLGVDPDKISVIYLAADEAFKPIKDLRAIQAIKDKYHTGEHFVLHVGTLNPRKNLEFLIRVFAEAIKGTKEEWKLVITGKKGWYYEGLFEAVEELGLEDRVVFTGYIDEVDKPLLYNAASIFAFPSLYEGAGLPPLEAMRCSTPVISSNTSSMPEMVGDGGILLSPKDKRGWIKELAAIMKNEKYRFKLVDLGLKHAQKFTWRSAAEQTKEVYERVYGRYAKNPKS